MLPLTARFLLSLLAAHLMTHLDRILRDVLHDPWTSRIFLAFTVGMFLSCSAEFAAGQPSTTVAAPPAPIAELPNVNAIRADEQQG